MENAAKQMRDVVVGHIPVLGLPGMICLCPLYLKSVFLFGYELSSHLNRAPVFNGDGVCLWNQVSVCSDDWISALKTHGVTCKCSKNLNHKYNNFK